MFNRKNTAFSARKKSTPVAAPSMTGRDRIKRAAAAMFEPLETRLLMSYTFTKLADLNNTTGTGPDTGVYVDSAGDLFGTTTYGGRTAKEPSTKSRLTQRPSIRSLASARLALANPKAR